MRRAGLLLAATCTWVAAAPAAAAVQVFLEPVQAGVVHMDALYTQRAGVEGRTAAHLALGAGVGWRDWQLGIALGRAASSTDFGLLEDPGVRLERLDTHAELRWRTPLQLAGWRLQAVAGMGRLTLRYHPGAITVSAGGETFVVSLDETHAWTTHVAAELLHAMHGNAWIALRGGGSFYTLDVASPTGPTQESMRDLQFHVVLRLRLH